MESGRLAWQKPHTSTRTSPHHTSVLLHMRHTTTPRSFTKLELLIILTIITVLLAILIVVVSRALADARFQTDVHQIVEMHQSWIVGASETYATAPLPGRVVATLNSTPEDYTLNDTARIYALGITRHYFTPDLLISPLEVSDHVTEAEFDFSAFDPLNGIFWDPAFTMHIEDPDIGANASYAHIAAVGDRRKRPQPAKSRSMPILGTRGPNVTNLDPAEYTRSPTYRFSKPYDQWVGTIAFADNHTETLRTFYPQLTAYQSPGTDRAIKDNIFSADFDHPHGRQAADDAFLCICTGATQFTVDDVYDPLLDD